jgi:hypothetical protein
MLPGMMLHDKFADPESALMRKNRDEPVPFTIYLDLVDHVPAVTFETAIEIVQFNTR